MLDLPERRLWAAVLANEIVVALRGRDSLRAGGTPDAAERWLGSADFAEVCVLAGVDPEWVERETRRQLALPRHLRRAEILRVGSVSSRATIQDRRGLKAVRHG